MKMHAKAMIRHSQHVQPILGFEVIARPWGDPPMGGPPEVLVQFTHTPRCTQMLALEPHEALTLEKHLHIVNAGLSDEKITDEALAEAMADAECENNEALWKFLSASERRTWVAAAQAAKKLLNY